MQETLPVRKQDRKPVQCSSCSRPIRGGKTSKCARCWGRQQCARRIKWPWRPEWDAALRAAYASCVIGKPSAAIDKLEAVTGYPRYIVRLRAQRLGITRDQRRPWKNSELEYLRTSSGRLAVKEMAKHLRRSWDSVQARLKIMGVSGKLTEGYSITAFSDVMGVSPTQVRRWLARGWLRLNPSNRITEAWVIRLFTEHLRSIDLRLCRQAWLKELLATVMSGRSIQ